MISIRKVAQVLCVIAFLCASLFGQTVTSTLIGTLIDPAGAVVPNADVKLTDQDSGASRTGKTNELGLFRFTNLATGTYTIAVKAQGFKTYEQKAITLASSSTRDLGRIELSIGALADTVEVTAEVTPVQVSSSEKSSLVDGDQLNKLALKGRDLMVLLNTLPGVYVNTGAFAAETTSEDGIRQVSINGAPTGKANFLVDGVVDLDSGSYQTTHYEPNMDAVAEVRVLTAGYQAEYGRSSGGTISVITKGGGRTFHGSAFGSKRHEMFNANSWYNNWHNIQKPIYRYFIGGFSIGGPAYIPKVFNKDKNRFFFFFSQEYTKVKPTTVTNNYRVPTAAERIGDFSNYRNSAGTMQPIKDPTTQVPIPTNVLPPSWASPMGAAMLNFFPLPNRCDLNNNATGCYNETDPSVIYTLNFRNQFTGARSRRNDVLRFDANITSKLTTFWRYINDYDMSQEGGNISLKTGDGSVVPYSEDHPNPGHGYGIGITYTISPTIVNEFTFGKSYNTWDWYPHDPSMMDRARMNNPAHWFDENGPDFKNDGNLARPQMAPGAQNFGFWIPNVQGGTVSSPGSGRPYTNWNDVYSFSDTVSWLKGGHTVKVGYYYERTGKVQQAGSGNYLGAYNFGSSSSFPLDAGLGNANMFLGNFQNYGEGKRIMGDWWFTGVEAFVQDSWRVRKGLTVELGVRFYDLQPQENLNNNSAMFLLSSYDPAKAGRYYYRGCKPTGSCTSAANQLAVDLVTGFTTVPVLAGTFVPYSVGGYTTQPDYFVGNEVAGVSTKIPRSLFTAPRYMPAARVGIAWDVFGNGKTAIRASFGQFYQRGDGNQIMNYGGQPPIAYSRTVYYQNITAIPTLAATAAISPGSNSQLAGKQRYEESMNVNFGFQHSVGFQTVVEASFVGAYRRHTFQSASQRFNAIPMFSQYNPAYMDPWSTYTPKRAYADNYFRPLQGIGDVSAVSFSGSANYNSLQVAVRRSMSRGLSLGLAYTFQKTMSIGSPSAYTDNPFFKYRNKGASFSGGGPHMLVINYVYEVPKLAPKLGFKPLGWVTDNWTISGITTYSPYTYIGAPGAFSFSGTNTTNLPAPVSTGSAEGARMIVMKNPAFSDGQWEYHIFDWNAFQTPMPCSWTAQPDPHDGIGQSMSCFGNAGSGALIKVPIKQNNWDLTFAKSFPVFGEGRMLTFRAEMYNVWNHTQISGISTGITYDFVKWKTGVLAPAANDTFGRFTGARDPRRMAMTLRFQF